MNFIPFNRMEERLLSSKSDSDATYFFDLLLYGEFVTKVIALFLVASINEDKERTRYRHEYTLLRANAIGDFSKVIDEIAGGPSSQLLTSAIQDNELRELNHRAGINTWQYDAQKLLYDCLEIFKINNGSFPSKSALKNWFSYFTYLRNKTRGHGATRINPCTLAAPLLQDSIKLITNNFTAFSRPWSYLYRNLSGKYRVSPLNKFGLEFDFLKKSNSYNYENGIYCYLDSIRKINLFFSNTELTDFYITNGNLNNTNYETISYLSDERVDQSARDYLNPISSLPQSQTEGYQSLETVGNCFTNIPKLADDYIKRPFLEKELIKVLSDEERYPIVTLLGAGGIGKTSLAINVIREITLLNRFDLIIWFSSRDIDLLPDGPKQVQTKILNPKDISLEYCNLIGIQKDKKEYLQFFSNELTKNSIGKALYVFDNFETVTNPIEMYEWISTYIRNPNKVLITSRISRNFKADYPIEVLGMTEPECKNLIDVTSEKLNIKEILTPRYIDELINESDGHPYIIKILLGDVAKEGKTSKIQRIVADKDKILTALFKRTFNTLSPAAKRVFLTLCSWNSMIPVIALEGVLWRPENDKMDVQGAIEELRKSSFISIVNEFINVPLAANIFGRNELEVYHEKFKILDDKTLLLEFGATSQGNITTLLASKIERKFKAVAKRIKSKEEFENELPTLEYIASKYPKALLLISEIFEEYKDYDKVKYYLREYLKCSITYEEKEKYWTYLAEICGITEDWDGESHALSEIMLIPGISYKRISNAANRINHYFYNHPKAREIDYKKVLLDKAIDVMKRRISEANATDYSRLAWLLLNNNDEASARYYVERGCELERENQHCQKLKEKFKVQLLGNNI